MVRLQQRFGRLVAAHRKRLGLRQADLAELSGLSLDMVAKLEVGATGASFESIERLANALKVDPAEFFSHELGGRPVERRALTDLVAELAPLTDQDLAWVTEIIRAALRSRR